MIALLLLLQADDLVYEKRATREETHQASLKATLEELPALTLEPWKVLDGRIDAKALRARKGVVDLGAGWRDGSSYADGTAHRHGTPTAWYRVLVAAEAMEATVTVGTQTGWDCLVNGEPVSLATHNSTHLLPSKRLDFRIALRKGTNHLLLEVRGPSEVYFDLSRLSPELRIALERRLDADFPTPASEQYYYRLEAVALPKGVPIEVGGMTFARDGTLVVCTRRGEIWRLREGAWSLFASGLHEPLGLWAEDPSDVAVVQRAELTRVRDTDGDGTADRFDALSQGWVSAGGSTSYAFGLLKDREGNWVGSTAAQTGGRFLGWCFKVTPGGEFVPWASGLRTPNGLAYDLEGNLFIADNQGEYVGTSALYHVEKGGFYGHPRSLPDGGKGLSIEELDRRRAPAALQFPHGLMGRSPSEPICDTTGGRFGPFPGQLFIGDQSSCIVMRAALEKVGGAWQGACFPFRSGFQSGNNRLAWAPDGSLWVGQTDRGYGAVGGRPFGLEKLTWTGRVPFEIRAMRAVAGGFELEFTRPVGRRAAADPATYSMQRYRYLYHATYGSPQVDVEPVRVYEARVTHDGRRVTLALGGLQPGRIYELHVRGLSAEDGHPLLHGDAYYTVVMTK